MITLVLGFSNLVHKHDCFAIRKSKVRVIAPELDESEIMAFLGHRKMDHCKACIRVPNA